MSEQSHQPSAVSQIVLTDELDHSEPEGYLVILNNQIIYEYKLFENWMEAKAFALGQMKEAGKSEWKIYPVYATHPMTIT